MHFISLFLITNSKSSIKKFDKKNKDKGYEDIQIRIPDISEIKKLIKWKATTSIEQGLNKMIKSYEKI